MSKVKFVLPELMFLACPSSQQSQVQVQHPTTAALTVYSPVPSKEHVVEPWLFQAVSVYCSILRSKAAFSSLDILAEGVILKLANVMEGLVSYGWSA